MKKNKQRKDRNIHDTTVLIMQLLQFVDLNKINVLNFCWLQLALEKIPQANRYSVSPLGFTTCTILRCYTFWIIVTTHLNGILTHSVEAHAPVIWMHWNSGRLNAYAGARSHVWGAYAAYVGLGIGNETHCRVASRVCLDQVHSTMSYYRLIN